MATDNPSTKEDVLKAARAYRKKEAGPLHVHASGTWGRWARKIRGQREYFGQVDPEAKDFGASAALTRYNEERTDLEAGRRPRVRTGEETELHHLVNSFLTAKKMLLDSGELAPRTFAEYEATGQRLARVFGRRRLVDDLGPEDFAQLRADISKHWGVFRVGNEIQRTRSIFLYGTENGLITKVVRFGTGFRKPTAAVVRRHRGRKGDRTFEPASLLSIINAAGPGMKCMILLAINGGLGSTDCAELQLHTKGLHKGLLAHPRAKTGIGRFIPLWVETRAAIAEYLKVRPTPADESDANILFIGARGTSYVGQRNGERVAQEFRRACEKAGVKGHSFYDLRRSFETVGGETGDQAAVDSIMGHAPGSDDMAAIYRQRVDTARLERVTGHVRAWLYGDSETE